MLRTLSCAPLPVPFTLSRTTARGPRLPLSVKVHVVFGTVPVHVKSAVAALPLRNTRESLAFRKTSYTIVVGNAASALSDPLKITVFGRLLPIAAAVCNVQLTSLLELLRPGMLLAAT
jgi:hypothetical protein